MNTEQISKIDRSNPWKEQIIDKLIVDCIYREEHENDPKLAINDLLSYEQQLCLDPLVSQQAVELVRSGAHKAFNYLVNLAEREFSGRDEEFIKFLSNKLLYQINSGDLFDRSFDPKEI